MNSDIRISVYIVSYNQEKYIAQAIESILAQSVSPYEVYIFDDHSTDHTWDIIQEYQKKYPDLLKMHRHSVNQGVFQNFNYAESHLSGNLITCVAGDDYIMPGYFEDVIRCITENSLDPDKDSFIIVPNIINLFENGEEVKHSNKSYRNKDLLSLRLRGLLDDRYGIVSRPSFDSISPYIEDIGIHADFVWGVERYISTDNIYFIDGYYSVYRVGVGVVSRTKELDSALSLIKAIDIIINRYGNIFKYRDICFLKYLRSKSIYQSQKTIYNYFSLLWSTMVNIGNFKNYKKQIKALIFPILPYRLKMFLFQNKKIKALSK